jgi:2-C-methyl-D-erythritol 4-phosphate cytidylyltransferase
MNIALVFAGGSGTRMGAAEPKQFLEIRGKPVLAHTLSLFQEHPEIDGIWLVVAESQIGRARELAARYGVTKLSGVSTGGDSAQESIYNGLAAMNRVYAPDTVVLLHDGVRPYVDPQVISDNIAAVVEHGSAVTFTPCYETIVISKDGRTIDALPYRRESYTAQAPQSFRLGDILDAHERIRARPERYTDMIDQATICRTLGIPIHLVPGNRGNIKVTTPEDLCMLAALLSYRENKKNGRADSV